jgi:hypothetical protein
VNSGPAFSRRCLGCFALAPLDALSGRATADAYWMFFGGLERHVGGQDWKATLRLVQPDSPGFLPDRDDFCATLAYVVFKGCRSGNSARTR